MRRLVLPAAVLTTSSLLLGGCGDDGGGTKADATPTPTAPSTTAGPSADSSRPAEKKSDQGSDPAPSGSPTASESGTPAMVTEVAEKLDCDLADGTDGFEGETEYICGPYLIADWNTAGVTETEMFDKIGEWVDEKRPEWMYAGDMVIIYGTKDNLDAVAGKFK